MPDACLSIVLISMILIEACWLCQIAAHHHKAKSCLNSCCESTKCVARGWKFCSDNLVGKISDVRLPSSYNQHAAQFCREASISDRNSLLCLLEQHPTLLWCWMHFYCSQLLGGHLSDDLLILNLSQQSTAAALSKPAPQSRWIPAKILE